MKMYSICQLLIIFILMLYCHSESIQRVWKQPSFLPHRFGNRYKQKQIKQIAELVNVEEMWKENLDFVMRPRLIGTKNHTLVREFIKKHFQDLGGWTIEEAQHSEDTVVGEKTFTNLIISRNVYSKRQIVLSAHYDSLIHKDGDFLGAIDSAAPCAMLMHMAKVLDPMLKKYDAEDLSLQIIFFDGEEAFVKWTATDSIYGARFLGKKFENEKIACKSEDSKCEQNEKRISKLQAMDSLVLLDLLGSPNPQFYNIQKETTHFHDEFIRIEKALNKMKMLENYKNMYFIKTPQPIGNRVEDDHLPFFKRGVPVVHLIPLPFPKDWHKITDDWSALDKPTISNLMKIFTVMTAEYLNLNPDFLLEEPGGGGGNTKLKEENSGEKSGKDKVDTESQNKKTEINPNDDDVEIKMNEDNVKKDAFMTPEKGKSPTHKHNKKDEIQEENWLETLLTVLDTLYREMFSESTKEKSDL